MPRVSVLMPCRNVAAFLHPCIESLCAQTVTDFEVVAVDDSSSDETAALLASWARQDSRVRLFIAEGNGIIKALNEGLHHVTGEFVARMDADDIAHPQRLEKQLLLFDDDAALAACGTHVRYFPRDQVREGAQRYESWLNSLTESDEIERDMFVECPLAHPTLMIRTAVLLEVGGYADRGWPEDYDLILRVFAAGKRMRNVPEVLHEWRESSDRLSRTDARYSDQSFRECKAHYLAQTLLRDRQHVVICGAGPIGRHFAKLLRSHGCRIDGFVDVDDKKIGRTIEGALVSSPDELATLAHRNFVVGAVSGAEPRQQIRQLLRSHGRQELRDFVMVA